MKKRWKPKMGEGYWAIEADGTIVEGKWAEYDIDKKCFTFGNCFRTKREAQAALIRVKEALKGK